MRHIKKRTNLFRIISGMLGICLGLTWMGSGKAGSLFLSATEKPNNSGSCSTVYAADWPEGPSITGDAAVVMDVNSGAVLYEKNAHKKEYPASITKILTAVLALENSTMEENVTFSYDAVHKTEGSGIWRDVDEVLTMEQCLYALMLNSANDCAHAIAEHVGGTLEQFVTMMNDRAAALGCTDTHFTNPHGLPDEDHYTSAYDMALIASDAIQNETFQKIIATKTYQIGPTNKHPDETVYLQNHHKMLFSNEQYYYEYCIGGKTGYTQVAGNTLVTYARKDGMTLVCVVLKETPGMHYEDSRTLLSYCFEQFTSYNLREQLADEMTENILTGNFWTSCLPGGSYATIAENAAVTLPAGTAFQEAEREVVAADGTGDRLATLEYTYNGHLAGRAAITKTSQIPSGYSFTETQTGETGQTEAGTEDGSRETAKAGFREKHPALFAILRALLIVVVILLLAALLCRYRYEIVDLFDLIRFPDDTKRERAMRRRKRRRRIK